MLAKTWFFVFAIVVVPGYVIWSRRWRGVGWLILLVVLWYILACASLLVGGLMIYGPEWLHALGL